VTLEERTARLTILIDPRKKTLFEQLCEQEDATPSQVVRRLIRRYIEEKTGKPWIPADERVAPSSGVGAKERRQAGESAGRGGRGAAGVRRAGRSAKGRAARA
jgi:hypothetical protein